MENKLKLIETENYVLAVSDEEIKESNWYVNNNVLFLSDSVFDTGNNPNQNRENKLVIACQPKGNAPELDLPLLPEMVVENNVQNFIEPLLKKKAKENNTIDLDAYALGLIDSYKSATKTFSEDDLRNCFYDAKTPSYEDFGDWLKAVKQNKQPKWFAAETETVKGKYIGRVQIGITPSGEPIRINEGYEEIQRLKNQTINGKIYLAGTYLYE